MVNGIIYILYEVYCSNPKRLIGVYSSNEKAVKAREEIIKMRTDAFINHDKEKYECEHYGNNVLFTYKNLGKCLADDPNKYMYTMNFCYNIEAYEVK